jgi:transcriptional regulator with XRE-family HTH domain
MSSLVANFGRRVAELREAAGLDQEQVAAAIDVTRGQVGHIERGEAGTRIARMEELATVLAVDPADLLTFPWLTYRRHRARDLVRACPTRKLDGLLAVMEAYLADEIEGEARPAARRSG